jgi:hypothetical protein
MSSQILHARKSHSGSLRQRLSSKLGLTIEYAIPSNVSVEQTQERIQHHLIQEITHGKSNFFCYTRRYKGSCVHGKLELHGPFGDRRARNQPLLLLTQGRLVEEPAGCVLHLQIKMPPERLKMQLSMLLLYSFAAVCILSWFAMIVLPVQLGFGFLAIKYHLENEASIVRNLLRDRLMDAG